MRKLARIALVAAGALAMTACSGAEDGTAANATNASADAGNLVGDESVTGNGVSAADSEDALANGAAPSIDAGNGLDATGNAADLTGNGATPAGNAF